MTIAMIIGYIGFALLAMLQNISFSLVSRSRNRNNFTYHIIASVFSNGVWYLTFKHLLVNEMSLDLFLPYTVGTVTGSVIGVKISMCIERWLFAESDSHIQKYDPKKEIAELNDALNEAFSRIDELELQCRGC